MNAGPPPGSNAFAQPGPVQVTLQTRSVGGETFVVLVADHVVGTTVLHLPAEMAEALGEGMRNAGRQARTGLIVPSAVIPSNVNGNGGPR